MDYSNQQPLFSKRNIFIFVILLLLIVSVPLAVFLLRPEQTTELRSRASKKAVDEIKFKEPAKIDPATGEWVTTIPTIKMDLLSPYGPRR